MKQSLILVMVWMMTMAAFGQQTYSTNVTVNAVIPDNNPNGLAEGIAIGGLGGAISNVTVSVDITGGFNGDLYAYLAGPSGGFVVLLNRVGVSNSASAYGYGDTGFNVTLSDTAANGNIHYYQNMLNPGGAQLTGTWQPDGANIDPQSTPSAFLSAGQTAMLSSFVGANANGTWMFFIADLSLGGQSTLASVGLNIMTVPEPSTLGLAVFGVTVSWVIMRRRSTVRFEPVFQDDAEIKSLKTCNQHKPNPSQV